jgi:hypothetical protein
MTLRVIAGGTLAATPFALTACGGGGPSAKTITSAVEKTFASGRFSASYDGSLALESGHAISFTGSGAVDAKSHRSRVSVDFSSLATEAGRKGDRSAFRGEEIVDSTGDVVVFLRIPYYGPRLPRGKPWLRIDFGKTIREHGLSVNELTLNQDPSLYLDYLGGVSGKVTKVGKESVGGVRTTRYHASIFMLDYPQALTGARQTAAEHLASRIAQLTGAGTFPTDVWIDQDGRVRQVIFTYTIPSPTSSRPISYRLKLSYSRFGAGPAVSSPPAGETARTSELKSS